MFDAVKQGTVVHPGRSVFGLDGGFSYGPYQPFMTAAMGDQLPTLRPWPTTGPSRAADCYRPRLAVLVDGLLSRPGAAGR